MKDPIETIERFVDNNYGDLITTKDPYYDRNRKLWSAELKSDYPRFIHDDKNPQTTIVKYITLRDLGEVTLSNKNIIEGTPRSELVSRLHSSLQQWREQVEEIILASSADKLAQIGNLKDTLNPIVVIIDWFARADVEWLSYEEIRKDPRSKRMLRWLRFLSQLRILEEKDDGFTYGAKFAELLKQSKTPDRMVDVVISYVMRNHYSVMKQVLDVSRFDPYIHMETCYYAPSLEAGRLLYRKEESLLSFYHHWYPRIPDYRLTPVLGQLQKVGLLHRDKEYWVGDEETWKALDPMRKAVPEEITPLKS